MMSEWWLWVCLHRKSPTKESWLWLSVLTGDRAEDLLLAGIRLLPSPLQDLLDWVEQAEHLGEVTEHRHLYQTGIWDQCGNQSKGHLVSQKGGTNSAFVKQSIMKYSVVRETNSNLKALSCWFFSHQPPKAAEFVLSFHFFFCLCTLKRALSLAYALLWRCISQQPLHISVVLYLCPVSQPVPCAAARRSAAPGALCWCWSPLHPANQRQLYPSRSSACPLWTDRQTAQTSLSHCCALCVWSPIKIIITVKVMICVGMCAPCDLRSH